MRNLAPGPGKSTFFFKASCFLIFVAIGFAAGLWAVRDVSFLRPDRPSQSIRAYSFQSGFLTTGILGDGWQNPAFWGAWSNAARSSLHVKHRAPVNGELQLEFVMRVSLPKAGGPQTAKVSVNGTALVNWTFSKSERDISRRVMVPRELWRASQPALIAFEFVSSKAESNPDNAPQGNPSKGMKLGLERLVLREVL